MIDDLITRGATELIGCLHQGQNKTLFRADNTDLRLSDKAIS